MEGAVGHHDRLFHLVLREVPLFLKGFTLKKSCHWTSGGNASQCSEAENRTTRPTAKTTQNLVTRGLHPGKVPDISRQSFGIAMVASERHPPKQHVPIHRTVDGSTTEVRRGQWSKAKLPIETQPGSIVTTVSVLHH
jgi:hypothetical protein